MRQLILSLIGIGVMQALMAQQTDHIHTSGKYILGPCGDTLHLKGINYAPYNWGYDINELRIDQLAQTGANAVRLPWYQNNPGASVYSNYVALDSVLSKCVQHGLIAIVELHDFTCQNDHNALTSGSAWWTNSSVLPILNKYRESIIVNIANEALYANWTGDLATALTAYKNTYQTIIGNLRNVTGFTYPLMIDAPDCGQNSDAFLASGTAFQLINADPEHNLIFSAHAYWYAYANNDSTQMANKVNAVLTTNIPFVLGEIANQQDDQSMCQYNLNYQPLLRYCEVNEVNWLAWSWDRDGCPQRQMSSNGNFSALTAYGNDLVNNPDYGLNTRPAAKSEFLISGTCGTVSLTETQLIRAEIYPNPNNGTFQLITTQADVKLSCRDLTGKEIKLMKLGNGNFQILSTPGIYLLRINSEEKEAVFRVFVD